MTGAYTLVLVTHVLVAILGLGSIAAIALISTTTRRSGRGASDASTWLTPLLRASAFSLVLMFLTGASLDYIVGGAFSGMWWFRASGLLLFATGALHGLTRRAVRMGASLQRIERLAYTMCVLIAAITALMEAKPF